MSALQPLRLRARPYSYPVAAWAERYMAGETMVRIAVDAAVSSSTVHVYLRRAGVPMRGRKEREA
jgi:hypothetical protein